MNIIYLVLFVLVLETQPSNAMQSLEEEESSFNIQSLPNEADKSIPIDLKNVHNDFDIIVIGGGPIGLSAAYNCAKAGQKVAVFEQSSFFNQSGSSGDLVRMFRTMYTEDFMADLAKQTIHLWKELESDAAEQLILMTGLLNFGDPAFIDGPEGNLMSPIKNLQRLGMAYRILNAEQIMTEYPFKNLPNTFQGIYAPDNGCINVSLVLRSLHRLSMAYGAHLMSHAYVSSLKPDESGVEIQVKVGEGNLQTFRAKKTIIACGAYTNHVLNSVGIKLNLSIWEMTSAYFASDPGPQGALFPSMWFQFLDPTDGNSSKSNLFYGFPTLPWGPLNMVRIAVDNAVSVIEDPIHRHILPSADDIELASNFVAKHCKGVEPHPCFQSTCLQTNVPDNMFVLDYLPETVGAGYKNVLVFTAGWAFKFVPLIGRVLKDLAVEGQTPYDISHFKISRPGVMTNKEIDLHLIKVKSGI